VVERSRTGTAVTADAPASQKFVTGPLRYARMPGAGHWIPLDAPDEVSAHLREFLDEG
jgi:pimeloyl-ACP methyl ester carboxylesterase